MTLCSSKNCTYRSKCARGASNDIDSTNDTYYNFESGGCDSDNGYSDYVKEFGKVAD